MSTEVCRIRSTRTPGVVYIGRGSKWGNPFATWDTGHRDIVEIVATREEAIERYEAWLMKPEQADLVAALPQLRDKLLGCWCKPKACHGDVLARLADGPLGDPHA